MSIVYKILSREQEGKKKGERKEGREREKKQANWLLLSGYSMLGTMLGIFT